jgi:uncharacterized repeat protein (TIGR02543 family)
MKKIFLAIMAALVVFSAFPLGAKTLAATEATSSLPNFSIDFNLVPFGDKVIQVELGNNRSAALTQNGKVFQWGGFISSPSTPSDITASFNLTGADKIIQLALGYDYSLALSQDGKVFSWTQTTGRTDITSSFQLSYDKVVSIAAGRQHSAALTENGNLYLWGYNVSGQIGNNSTTYQMSPLNITNQFALIGEDRIVDVKLGYYHSAALTANGRIFTWGYGYNGQLGDNATQNRSVPTEITSRFALAEGDKLVQINLGSLHTGAISANGRVFLWGNNEVGNIGDNTSLNNRLVPTEITSRFTLSENEKIVKIELGSSNSAALTSNGGLYIWGSNAYGEIGDGSFDYRYVPRYVQSLVADISYGYFYGCSVKTNGDVYTWGINDYGQLGDNSTTDRIRPTLISVLSPPVKYTMTFEANGGSAVASYLEFAGTALNVPTSPTKTGYTFAGWFSNSQLTTAYTFTTMPAQNTTIYAKWTPVNYSITYQTNGGTNHASNPGQYHIESASITLLSPTKNGYSFDGWYEEALFSGSAVSQITLGSTGNKTFYAKWLINSYTISFVSNGGSLVSSLTQDFDSQVSAPTSPTKASYAFAGWFSNAQLTDAYAFTTMPAQNTTVYAKWTPVNYSITYQTNGGTNHISNPAQYHIESATITLLSPTKTGHAFAGWYEDALFSGSQITQIAFGSMGNKTLYAKWTLNSYTMSFASNGGSLVSSITQDYGTAVSAPANPTRTGYTFVGWNPTFPSTVPGQNQTYNAQWIVNSYRMTFDSAGGGAVGSILDSFGRALNPPVNPTRTGYTFAGWSPEIPSTVPAFDQTFTAQWTVNTYTMTFDSVGGSIVNDITQEFGSNLNAPANPSRTGYAFTGWSPVIPSTIPAQNQTFTAQWTINSYTMTFDSAGGSAVGAITQAFGMALSNPANPTKTGYTFAGWSPAIPSTVPAQNQTFTAQWTVNTYTMTFDSAGGSLVDAITQAFGTALSNPANPTKTGYTFAGWSPQVPSTVPAQHQNFTAQWTVNTYTLTFDTTGGSVIEPIVQAYGTSIVAPANPTREGYVFNGWNQTIPATMPSENRLVQAYWILFQQESDDLDVETDNLHDKVDAEIMEGKDVEFTVKIEVKSQDLVHASELQIIQEAIQTDLAYRNYGSLFLSIEILMKASGQDDVRIDELTSPMTFTLVIPETHRGYKNYRILRVHDGTVDILEASYDAERHTLTFETDRFSTYTIAYDMGSGFAWGWLFLLLLIPVGYALFFYRKSLWILLFAKAKQEEEEHEQPVVKELPVETFVQLDEVVLPHIEERPKHAAFETVENGEYLEITQALEASNRVVEVSTGVLPKLINPENAFVLLEKEEVLQFKDLHLNLQTYLRLTPGSYAEAGYYMEVDLDSLSVDNYVHVKKRLPPTSAKGHRWVKIEPRKIKSEN